MSKRPALALLLLIVFSHSSLRAQQSPAAPPVTPAAAAPRADDAIKRIRDEGLNRSQVMRTLSYLTDVIGPRLTASPNMKRANEWTRDRLSGWGLQNAHLEAWGPFGRGWTLTRFSAQVIEPQAIPLIGYPKAWSPGTKGTLTADVVYLDAADEAALAAYRGKLKGKIVLVSAPRTLTARFEPLATRYNDERLAELAAAAPPANPNRPNQQQRQQQRAANRALTPRQRAAQQFIRRKREFVQNEQAALIIDDSTRGDGGTLFVQSALVGQPADTPVEKRIRAWDKAAARLNVIPQITLASEHYNRLVRMLQQGENLRMAVDLGVVFHDTDLMGYNTLAEIPGTDKKDEIVMLGAHLDSWHSATGATDNAAGVAVCMEAVRILQTLKLAPRRTVRIALWSGEEQGLFGSRAYVSKHFGTREGGSAASGRLTTKPEYGKLSAYFNLDNGTGKIRGVFQQNNAAVGPIFREWLAPFADLGASTLTLRGTGSTDHMSFDAIGLPGFQFIQDAIEYGTRTHHSNQDVYDRIQEDDMKQAAVIMAAFVYNTAMRDEKLPRKPAATAQP